MSDYIEFLKNKSVIKRPAGFDIDKCDLSDINKSMFEYQSDIVKWAMHKGRCAIFADCGMGKTLMQLEWAAKVHEYAKGDVLIVAPLAVSEQTVREGAKFGYNVNIAESMSDIKKGLNITNYEKLDHFDINNATFSGLVLDESSILKNFAGKTCQKLIDTAQDISYRLACTATPAPNDFMELGTHAEFLGIMTRSEMLAMYFIHDSGSTQKWRLKGHAGGDFWEWVCTWAVMIRKPSDLGYADDNFILPELNIEEVVVESEHTGDFLFAMDAKTLQERQAARRETIEERAKAAAALILAEPDKQWLVWCNLNDEAKLVSDLIDDMVNIQGSDKDHIKAARMLGFTNGEPKNIVTKPKIAGMGMNWQHCDRMIFLGLSDSFEQYYQAVRRCWRFGQENTVNAYIVISDREGAVVENIKRKEADAELMAQEMVKNMKDINTRDIHGDTTDIKEYSEKSVASDKFIIHNADCVEVARRFDDNSLDMSVFSPPFASLYTYSDSNRDMGNAKNDGEFYQQFKYLVKELYRATKPGRMVAFHCMNIPAMKERDGYMGLKNFRGDLISMFQDEGFIFHSEHCIWKDPLVEATRTKAHGLMHKQLCKDSTKCRSGIPDYLIAMRKPGDNADPVAHELGLDTFAGENEPISGNLSHERWRRYASPVWMDINQSRTLNYRIARDSKDERHICPLQLDVIERALWLWSNKGDTVFSPFAGIGSEGDQALRMGRKFIGTELKESYYNVAVKNLKEAEVSMTEHDLFVHAE